jgi:hypothetical protein
MAPVSSDETVPAAGRQLTGEPAGAVARTAVPNTGNPGTGPAGAAPPGRPGSRSRGGRPARAARAGLRRLATPAAGGHLLLVACYVLAGVAVTWPLPAQLWNGQLLKVADVSSYVWALWWVPHQLLHLGNPWFTQHMAAPAGLQLGFDTLMPLAGLIMAPVTLALGPTTSFAVLTIVTPGLLCYGTYRAARLWLRPPGAIAAGALFGLSTMVAWQNAFHLNITAGTIFLPLTLEAAVRLRRSPGRRQGITLGVILGASVLTNQESAVVAALLAAAVLVPWLVMLARQPQRAALTPGLRTLALGAVVAVAVASPQLAAMIGQAASGGTTIAAANVQQLTESYRSFGVGLPTLFAPSPRLAHFGLGQLTAAYQFTDKAQRGEGIPTFGVVLAALAAAGLCLSWRRRASWWLALLWLGGAALALGPTLVVGSRTFVPLATAWHGVTVSPLLPYTWLIRVPGLSALREADRLALLGLLGAAILAGAAVDWACAHLRKVVAGAALVVVAAAGFLEAGWSATGYPQMAAAMPVVDGPIAADHSGTIVVDVPFGLRGGVGIGGQPLPPQALVVATADGHPRAESYSSWVPEATSRAIDRRPFYRFLDAAQTGARFPHNGPDQRAAMQSARQLRVGWVIVWHSTRLAGRPAVISYLYATDFKIAYQVHHGSTGITVWCARWARACPRT